MAHWHRLRIAALPLMLVLAACGADASSASVPSSTPVAAELIEPAPTLDTFRDLTAGTRYRVADPFPVSLTFEVPEGFGAWAYTSAASQLNLASEMGEVSFEIIDNVVADPCARAPLVPPPGPSVDDLIAALSELAGFEATTPEDITIDGVPGKRFTLTAPSAAEATCHDLSTWRTSTRQNGVGPGEVADVHVLEVNGVRLAIAVARGANVPADDVATLQSIVDSVQFD